MVLNSGKKLTPYLAYIIIEGIETRYSRHPLDLPKAWVYFANLKLHKHFHGFEDKLNKLLKDGDLIEEKGVFKLP